MSATQIPVQITNVRGDGEEFKKKIYDALNEHGYTLLAEKFVKEVNQAKDFLEFMEIAQRYVNVR
jgi:hypothetical protein